MSSPVVLAAPTAAAPRSANITQQDVQWLALKYAHRIGRDGAVLAATQVQPLVSSRTLPTTVVSKTVEAWGRSNGLTPSNLRCTTAANESDGIRDDGGNCYKDQYYWNFCGAGAAENALQYWGQTIDNHGSGWYTEPSYVTRRTSTYWLTGGSNRAYEMYLAEYSKPPSFATPGLVAFGTYPNAGAVLSDVRDVLNWEASGKGSNWQNYFYARVSNSGLGAATLHADIVTDILNVGVPVVVEVNTSGNLFAPYWSNTGVIHYLTIIGYNDVLGTYTYTDTCGNACGSGQDGGVRSVSQANLYQAILNVGSGGGFVW
jgi:hypothetical protein